MGTNEAAPKFAGPSLTDLLDDTIAGMAMHPLTSYRLPCLLWCVCQCVRLCCVERDFLQSSLKIQKKQIAKLRSSIQCIDQLFRREIDSITHEVDSLDQRCRLSGLFVLASFVIRLYIMENACSKLL